MDTYLETAIAVILIVFIFSVVAYVIQELIAVNLEYRGKMLRSSIEQVLGGADTPLSTAFFEHPQIQLLQEKLKKFPNYIPSANFATALMDILFNTKQPIQVPDEFNTLFNSWSITTTNGDNARLKATIEKWYNDYMDRVSGWYKRKHRWLTRILAIVIALLFNLDMVRLTTTITGDAILRSTLAASANQMAQQPDAVREYYTKNLDAELKAIGSKYDILLQNSSSDTIELRRAKQQEEAKVITGYNQKKYELLSSLIDTASAGKLVFGWREAPWEITDKTTSKVRKRSGDEWLLMLLGLFIGAVAISMGAPFWFDMMLKLVNIRRAGVKPSTNDERK